MYVTRESGFMLGTKARLSQNILEQLWDRSTDALKDQLCVSISKIDGGSEQLCVPRKDLRVKKQQQQCSTLGRIKEWIQTKVLVFQLDSEVEQVDPNRNQVEQSKGLEVIKSKDMEVGLSRSQPWKRNPMNPINLSGFN